MDLANEDHFASDVSIADIFVDGSSGKDTHEVEAQQRILASFAGQRNEAVSVRSADRSEEVDVLPSDLRSLPTSLYPTDLDTLVEFTRLLSAESSDSEASLRLAEVGISPADLMRVLSSLDPIVLEQIAEAAGQSRSEPLRPGGAHAISVVLERLVGLREIAGEAQDSNGDTTTAGRVANEGVLRADTVRGRVGAHAIPGMRGTAVSGMPDQDLEQAGEPSGFSGVREEQREAVAEWIFESTIVRPHPSPQSPHHGSVPGQTSESPLDSNHQQGYRHCTDSGIQQEQPSEQEVDRKKRKTWVCVACILIVFIIALVLAVVLPLQLATASSSISPTSSPASDTYEYTFVKFGSELKGQNEGALLGASVEVVGDRWFAYGSPGHGVNRSGLVRVVDMYNGTQIGQDIVGNVTEGFTEVGRVLASAEGGWLAVAGRHMVRLLRYNYTSELWETHGRILTGSDIEASPSFETWYVATISINPFVLDGNTIGLVVSSDDPHDGSTHVHAFSIQADGSPEWQRQVPIRATQQNFNAMPFLTWFTPSFVPGPGLLVAAAAHVNAHRSIGVISLRTNKGTQVRLPLHDASGFAIFHRNSESTSFAVSDDNAISVHKLHVDLNRTDQGLPIWKRGAGLDSLALSKDWLVQASTTLVRVFRYNETANAWTQQGGDVLVDPDQLASVRVAVGGTPGSPKVLVVGLPGKSVVRYESVYLNSTNLASFTNQTNLFSNETGHVFANQSIVYGSVGSVQLYHLTRHLG